MVTNNQLNSREEMQMLTFTLDNVLYGVNVSQVREVKNFEGVTPVPYAPDYVRGVTNLRGEVIPVIDLRKCFGIGDKKDDKTNIMIIVQDKHPVGIMVDSVMDVLTLSKKDIEANLIVCLLTNLKQFSVLQSTKRTSLLFLTLQNWYHKMP